MIDSAFALVGVVVRGRIELPTFRFSGGRSYRLSYLTSAGPAVADDGPQAAEGPPPVPAVLTGFEPATSTLTGWRALRAALQDLCRRRTGDRAPNGIRTRAAALKGRCPRPLDDGGFGGLAAVTPGARRREPSQHRGGRLLTAKRPKTPASEQKVAQCSFLSQEARSLGPCAALSNPTR